MGSTQTHAYCLLIAATLSACASSTDSPVDNDDSDWLSLQQAGVTVEFQRADSSWAATLLADAQFARTDVHQFFGADTLHTFVVRVYPARSAMASEWRAVLGPPTMQFQCWMIAGANAARVLVLSPRVWSTDACGHSASDPVYVRHIVTHEIVHVLHRRLNPDPTFRTLAGSSWLVEGLAVFASGQFNAGMAAYAAEGLRAARPAQLSNVLDTSYGYAFAGSLLSYIDRTRGRDVVRALVRADPDGVFAILQTTPAALLSDWESSL